MNGASFISTNLCHCSALCSGRQARPAVALCAGSTPGQQLCSPPQYRLVDVEVKGALDGLDDVVVVTTLRCLYEVARRPVLN